MENLLSSGSSSSLTFSRFKVAEQTEAECPKVEKQQAEPPAKDGKEEEPEKAENGKTVEATNGDVEDKENGAGAENEESEEKSDGKVCSAKRKSAAGVDAADGVPAEGVTPEKKAKLDEAPAAEAESNGEPEVAA